MGMVTAHPIKRLLVLPGAEASILQPAPAADVTGRATGERKLVSVLYADIVGYHRT